jgi:hypothetical protein
MSAQDDAKAAQYSKEAKDPTSVLPSPAERQRMIDDAKRDAAQKKAAEKAPTTYTEMGKKYAKGGSVRGGGIESSGKTKGRFV